MTIKQLTDYLYEAGYSTDEVVFHVTGQVNHTEEILRGMSGDYEFSVDVDHECEPDDISRRRDGKVVIALEII